MDRMVAATICGVKRYLNFSVAVMFDAMDEFGSVNKLLELVQKESVDGFKAVAWVLVRMANDGELVRRAQGYDKQPLMKESDISMRMHPLEFAEMQKAAADAIVAGYKREHVRGENGEEVDLVLEEIEQKKTKAGV